MKKSLWFRFKAWLYMTTRCTGVCYDDDGEPPMPERCVLGLMHAGWCTTEYGYEFDPEEEDLRHAVHVERAERRKRGDYV